MKRQILKAGVVISLMLASQAFAGIGDGLLAYYSFNGNANDGSGNGYNGTVSGSYSWTTGKLGGALDLAGNGGVEITGSAGESSPLNIYNTDMTISAWVNMRGAEGTIVARSKPGYVTYNLGMTSTAGYIDSYVGYHEDVVTPPILTNGDWYHIVGVFDRTNNIGRVYINGVEEAQGSMAFDPPSDDATTKIGCRSNGSDFPFNGIIDEVRIYDRALSAQEVMELYQVPEPATLLLLGLGGLILRKKH